MTGPEADPRPEGSFGAFISYKREDEAFAAALEKALERYVPPPGLNVARTRLKVFRDRDDLTGTDYYRAIEKFIDTSSALVVICSPHARASPFINDEIERFAKAKGSERIVPVLIAGIPNNEAGPERDADRAFPDALCAALAMPLAVEFRGFDPARDRVDRGRFESAWHTLLANIYGVSRSDLESREQRRVAQRLRAGLAVATAAFVVLAGLTMWALVMRQVAVSRQLAADAIAQMGVDPQKAVALSVHALEAARTPAAEEALRRAMPQDHLRAILRDHTGWVMDLAFNRLGSRIATADETTVRIWDASSGDLVHTLEEKVTLPRIQFSPVDDALLLVAGDEPVVRVWNITTDRVVATLTHPSNTDKVVTAVFSTDGSLVVTASDSTVCLWKTATGAPVRQPIECSGIEYPGGITSASLSPDNRTVLTSHSDGTVRLRLRPFGHDGKPRPLSDPTGIATFATFSPDGRFVVTAGADHSAQVFELTRRLPRPLIGHTQDVLWAGFSRDGSNTVLTIGDKTARVWTGRTHLAVRHTDWVVAADFSPDAMLIATASEDGTARIWDRHTGLAVASLLGHTDKLTAVHFSPDGRFVATASADHTARIWQVPEVIAFRGHTGWVTSAEFSADGQHVVTASWDKTARVWNAQGGQPIATMPSDGEPTELNRARFSPDGRRVVTAGEDGTARVWDVGSRKVLPLSGHTAGVNTAAFSHDGARIVTAGNDGAVNVWDANKEDDPQPSALPDGFGGVNSAMFSPDDRVILATGVGRLAVLRNMETKTSVTLRGHTGIVRSGAFSRDGRMVVTTSGDGTARVWDVQTGDELAVLRGHTSRTTDAAFSPDGRLVVTASADTTVRVWEWASGRLLAVLDHHTDLVESASFSPDGRRILTSSDDGTARIVECRCDASVNTLIDQARSRVGPPLLGPPGWIERLRRLVWR